MTESTESGALLIAKITPPATVSVVTLAGGVINEAVIFVTLIYTLLMLTHKLFLIYKDVVAWRKNE